MTYNNKIKTNNINVIKRNTFWFTYVTLNYIIYYRYILHNMNIITSCQAILYLYYYIAIYFSQKEKNKDKFIKKCQKNVKYIYPMHFF